MTDRFNVRRVDARAQGGCPTFRPAEKSSVNVDDLEQRLDYEYDDVVPIRH